MSKYAATQVEEFTAEAYNAVMMYGTNAPRAARAWVAELDRWAAEGKGRVMVTRVTQKRLDDLHELEPIYTKELKEAKANLARTLIKEPDNKQFVSFLERMVESKRKHLEDIREELADALSRGVDIPKGAKVLTPTPKVKPKVPTSPKPPAGPKPAPPPKPPQLVEPAWPTRLKRVNKAEADFDIDFLQAEADRLTKAFNDTVKARKAGTATFQDTARAAEERWARCAGHATSRRAAVSSSRKSSPNLSASTSTSARWKAKS